MDFAGRKLNIEESKLKPGFLDYMREQNKLDREFFELPTEKRVQTKNESLFAQNIRENAHYYEDIIVQYMIEAGNEVWNGNRKDFESSLDKLLETAVSTHRRYFPKEEIAARATFPAPKGTKVYPFRYNSP